MIRNVIWDVDGTLFDTYPVFVSAFTQVLSGYDITIEAARILSLVKVSVPHAVEMIAEAYSLDGEELKNRFWSQYARHSFLEQMPFPGLERVCRLICERSGKNVIVTHRGLQSATALLREHGLQSYFADIVSLQSGYARKPDPEMFHVAIERNQLDPAETLAVGDREIDILAGAAAGLRTCVFQPVERPTSADWVIESYEELIPLLERR